MSKNNIKQLSLIGGILLVCIISLGYWIYNQFYVSTDDAYVNANVVQIAPRVTGQVKHLYVINNQYVKEGQPLFDLDPAIFETIVDQAKAQLSVSEAKLKLAEVTESRTTSLVTKRVASAQQGDDAEATLQAANANILVAKANLTQAELNLSYTKVVAPTSGWVTNVTLREGDVVTANQPLFALISDSEFWIDANFKETDIVDIHAGQKASVTVDMYPGHTFEGSVESISGGSGTAFSLLPPENATGNWVKVTQRVPVRVRIVNTDAKFPLRIGTSAAVSIRLSSGSK